jgi:hypothetical protein
MRRSEVSLYNMMFGVNKMYPILLKVLNLTLEDIGRFRDAFITENDEIAIYTRLGGGNREYYQETIANLRSHPNYKYDKDDDFDCTYATFYFSIPKGAEWLKVFKEDFEPNEKWEEKIEEIKTMSEEQIEENFPEVVKVLKAIFKE